MSTTKEFKDVLTMRTENLKVHENRRQLFSSSTSKDSSSPFVRQRPLGSRSAASSSAAPPPPWANASKSSSQLFPRKQADSDTQPLLQQQQQQQQQQMVPLQDSYMQSRAEALQNVEATIHELGSIFNQLATLVSQQGEIAIRMLVRFTEHVIISSSMYGTWHHLIPLVGGSKRTHILTYIRFGNSYFLMCLILIASPSPASGDLGATSYYGPPYFHTACYGDDISQFPPNMLFAAAGEEIWINGMACGRIYWVKCISSNFPNTACAQGQMIEVVIVDRAQTSVSRPAWSGTTMVLSVPAFTAIAGTPVPWVEIEYKLK